MYERSAIVLERYIEQILKLDKQYNLRENYNNFKGLIEELENYQIIATKEGKIIQEFDETVNKIETIQREQQKLYNSNLKLEEDRNKLFSDLEEKPETLMKNFQKIENTIEDNNGKLKELREQYIIFVSEFIEKQKERTKCEKERRLSETTHIEHIKASTTGYESIDAKDILLLKQIINSQEEDKEKEIGTIMTKNGKNENVPFNQDVLNLAIKTRISIAEKEANCYISIYDKMRRLLAEIDSDSIKLNKYKKVLRDTTAKLTFLNAEKEYIFNFLDYERITAINGTKAHNKMMTEACENFKDDISQINNLYELILKEISNKATKKAYKELYNKTYLKNIEDKERNFEQEITNININMGTVINSNYWRIDGIKNIYDVFQKEISEKFGRDLSEFSEEVETKVKENNETNEEKENEIKEERVKLVFSDEDDDDSLVEDDFQDEDLEELEYDEEEGYEDDDNFESEEDDNFDQDEYFDEEDEDESDDEYFDEVDEDESDDEYFDEDDEDDEYFEEDDDFGSDEDEFEDDEEDNYIDEDEFEEDLESYEEDEYFDEGEKEEFIEEEFEKKDLDDEKEKRKKANKKQEKNKKEAKRAKGKRASKHAKTNKGLFDKIFKDKKDKTKK